MAAPTYLLGAVQMTSTADRSRNLETAVRLVNEAADLGARLIGLPENFAYMGPEEGRRAGAETLEGPTVRALSEVARRRGVYVLAGSIAEKVDDPGKTANTSVLIADDGRVAAAYRKIHLFDVSIPDGARYAESEVVVPGDKVVIAPTPLGRVGLTVCYDLRFPELYRKLAGLGAEVITIPAAFTLFTGKDHWEVLLRARAIENLAYVMAPAQVGRHSASRQTFGNAMIVDPWGVVLARCPDGEGVCVAPFRRERLEQVRQELPALKHRKL
ncbi:Nitrilase/cyanide hydratase and apolipoprotein N-acyltransferase [Anaeromyxobacter dehalogenans 2CP-1]|uniref:Nitrilase/cyanide hydratase and apolipoprotein N-acyltransferase n=1 Tax=Anaeromyxobacter dehalogenans (strain ATCC BAA-258 / DSM 21875 / 2CP-1) TaxID=455488 RepID=B8J6R9_ANAD2|nr:carbon-nitrogen hydrolase family protein [Anaeromyxobacter dehalogenans]ACL67041.1 Nitrilase/cyanide hydratase and apolipoprotein N-acyltransferase [Anaeromyxobacter dehalogenans 2CP-1]